MHEAAGELLVGPCSSCTQDKCCNTALTVSEGSGCNTTWKSSCCFPVTILGEGFSALDVYKAVLI